MWFTGSKLVIHKLVREFIGDMFFFKNFALVLACYDSSSILTFLILAIPASHSQ
jgi:hypothetical protein